MENLTLEQGKKHEEDRGPVLDRLQLPFLILCNLEGEEREELGTKLGLGQGREDSYHFNACLYFSVPESILISNKLFFLQLSLVFL